MIENDVLKFTIDAKSGVPYYKQIILQVEMAISDGRLSPGDQLPTVRALAVDLNVNPNTVGRAYNEMEIREIVTTQQGTGTFISEKEIEMSRLEREKILGNLTRDFVSKAGSYGFTLQEIINFLSDQES